MTEWDVTPSTDEWFEALDGIPTLGDFSEGLVGEDPHCGGYLVFGGGRESLRRPGHPGSGDPPPPVALGLAAPKSRFLVFRVVSRTHRDLPDEEPGKIVALGRGPENDVFLPDESVANFHASIAIEDGSYYLRPGPEVRLAPLRLNGAPVSLADPRGVPLRPFDQITMGEVEVAFLLRADLAALVSKLP